MTARRAIERTPLAALVLASILPAIACEEATTEAPEPDPAPPEIAFWGVNPSGLFRIRTDGTELTRVTEEGVRVHSFAWSPDGSRLLFIRDHSEPGARGLWLVKADGSGLRMLIDPPPQPGSGGYAWSPNGSRIAYFEPDSTETIHVVDVDAGTTTPVRDDARGVYEWHPGGLLVICPRANDVCLVDPDGGAPIRLTETPDVRELRATLSPDGTRLAFAVPDGPLRDIHVMDVDGGAFTNLTSGLGGFSDGPEWSPDGGRIGFYNAGPNFSTPADVWTIRPDGSDLVNVSDDPGNDVPVAWSPAGDSVAFNSSRDGVADVWLGAADGSGVRRLLAPDHGFGSSELRSPGPWRPEP